MINKLPYKVDGNLLEVAASEANIEEFRYAINEPTGRFFYDEWKIKPEYQGTVWETIINTLPYQIGEARIIVLDPGKCYQSHADIDDRYHLNIQSDNSYLIDISDRQLYKIEQNGYWYDMYAGGLHSAANFGRQQRIQLVVRKLLNNNVLVDPVSIVIKSNATSARYLFDQEASCWLNGANKTKLITNFNFVDGRVSFDIERTALKEFTNTLDSNFEIQFI